MSVTPHRTPDDLPARDLPAAVLWDMDGTLVDTEPAWLAAEIALVEESGGTWTEADSLQMIGLPLMSAAAVLQRHGVDLGAEAIVARLLGAVVESVGRELPWQPGARELLVGLAEAGVPCALVTMSYRALADAVLAQGPAGVFSVVVTGDEVTRGKPHPEPYLRAAELLGVDITACVAVEDSPPGIASALASGARTLGVQHIAPVEARPGLSRTDSLARFTVADLRALARGEVVDHLAEPAA
ncbi:MULTISPECIES: HAD family phosphatase [unclassified Actinotalea]|uniref:HAD family hydrolase n=1 Tax=unclassified Actinotalea TaxID=2638618 RepID=UPI0021033F16|nr:MULTISPECIES: HAD family phosphatase [unclassified Actinotalea]